MRVALLGLLILTVSLPGSAALPLADQPELRLRPVEFDEFEPYELLLEEAGIGTRPDDLVAFLRKQVLPDKEREHIEGLIQQLGDERLDVRDGAFDKLLTIGAPVVPLLRQASRSASPDVAQRAGQALAKSARGPNAHLQDAAVRLLARKPAPETLAALLEFFPFAGEDWLEDNVLSALGTVATRDGKVDAFLEKALRDPAPARRGAAAAVLARWAGAEQRAAVRTLLADPDLRVRALTARGLLGDRFARTDAPLEDRRILTAGGVAADAVGLVAFFRQRTPSAENRKRLERLVQQLDSDEFFEREAATKQLIASGRPALSFLQPARKDASLEQTRRIEQCITAIEKEPTNMLALTAARELARHQPSDAATVLLDYVPFADNAAVEDEVIASLARLAVQQVETPAALVAGLKHDAPACRAVAALLVGLVGTKEQCDRIKPLLSDASPAVRLRAAEGLLAAKDKEAVPVLVALLGDGPAPLTARAEALLRELAGRDAPTARVGDAAARAKAHEAWIAWRRDRGDKLDLTAALRQPPSLGLTLVVDYWDFNGTNKNVWEYGPDGKTRWMMTDFDTGPIDAHVLPGNRVLVALCAATTGTGTVLERDMATGKVIWEWKHKAKIIGCQRLLNGNTFIVTRSSGFLEITPDKKEVYACKPGADVNEVSSAVKLRNGNIACIVVDGRLLEFDIAGKLLRAVQVVKPESGWNALEELPGNHLLITDEGRGRVLELNAERKLVGGWNVHSPRHAIRLPNGNLLVACGVSRKIAEVDPKGTLISEHRAAGQTHRVRRR